MGIAGENVFTYGTGTHPDFEAINSTGAATQDGTEIIAEGWNNFILGPWQAMFNYGGITPDGVTESQGASQYLEALRLGHAIGPGIGKFWFKADTPAVTGDRALVLSNQTVLIASYPELVSACYVGDGNNATAPYFYKSSDSGGVTRSTSGTYFTLPPTQPIYTKQYIAGNTYNGVALNVTGSNLTVNRGVFIPYKTSNGFYRLIGNLEGDISVLTTSIAITVNGATFYNNTASAGFLNDIATCALVEKGTAYRAVDAAWFGINNSLIQISSPSNFNNIALAFNVQLESSPTWADDFDYPICITY